jgi:hypothetical protein
MAEQQKRTIQMPEIKGAEWIAPTDEVKDGRLAPGKQYLVSAEFARYLVAHKSARFVEKGKPTDETAEKLVIDSRPGQEKWEGWADRRAEEVGVITPAAAKKDVPPPVPPTPTGDPHPTDPLPPPSDPSDEHRPTDEATTTGEQPPTRQTSSTTSKTTRAR